MDESLDRRFIEMSQVRCTLARLLSKHEGLWVDEAESINDDLSFNGLDRVDHNSDGSGCQLFEGLLSVDIDR